MNPLALVGLIALGALAIIGISLVRYFGF